MEQILHFRARFMMHKSLELAIIACKKHHLHEMFKARIARSLYLKTKMMIRKSGGMFNRHRVRGNSVLALNFMGMKDAFEKRAKKCILYVAE